MAATYIIFIMFPFQYWLVIENENSSKLSFKELAEFIYFHLRFQKRKLSVAISEVKDNFTHAIPVLDLKLRGQCVLS